MNPSMSYPEILIAVKAENPDLSHKDAQIEASKRFQKQKEEIAKANPPTDKAPKGAKKLNFDPAYAEEMVASKKPDHHGMLIQARNFDPSFELKEAGKDGVNTLIYFDGPCRIPAQGYYKVFK